MIQGSRGAGEPGRGTEEQKVLKVKRKWRTGAGAAAGFRAGPGEQGWLWAEKKCACESVDVDRSAQIGPNNSGTRRDGRCRAQGDMRSAHRATRPEKRARLARRYLRIIRFISASKT